MFSRRRAAEAKLRNLGVESELLRGRVFMKRGRGILSDNRDFMDLQAVKSRRGSDLTDGINLIDGSMQYPTFRGYPHYMEEGGTL